MNTFLSLSTELVKDLCESIACSDEHQLTKPPPLRLVVRASFVFCCQLVFLCPHTYSSARPTYDEAKGCEPPLLLGK